MVHVPLRARENDTWLFHGHLYMVYIQSATIYYELITFFISNLNSKNSPGLSRDLLTKDRGHVTHCRR